MTRTNLPAKNLTAMLRKVNAPRPLTIPEVLCIVDLYCGDHARNVRVEAASADAPEFDLNIEGECDLGGSFIGFRAWLPLAWLHERPEFWVHDDWSFMRDIPRDQLISWFTEVQNDRPAELTPAESAGVYIIPKPEAEPVVPDPEPCHYCDQDDHEHGWCLRQEALEINR